MAAGRPDNVDNFQSELARKFEISRVVPRHAHNRARAVTEQNIIGGPDRNFFIVYRVDRIGAGEDAGFLFGEIGALEIALPRRAFTIFAHRRPLFFCDDKIDKRMLWREHHVGRAVKRIGTSRENADFLFAVVDPEIDLCAFTAPDPIALKELDSFRPIERVQFVKQTLRKFRDTQHPLPHRPPHNREPTNLAFPVDNFLIRQNRAELRAPVDRDIGHVG